MIEYKMEKIVAYNEKQQNKYNKYINKNFKLSRYITLGDSFEFIFNKDKIKTKINDVIKDDDENKTFVLDTPSFTCLIKFIKYIENNEQ